MKEYRFNPVRFFLIPVLVLAFLTLSFSAYALSDDTKKSIVKHAVEGKPGVNHKLNKTVRDIPAKELMEITSDKAVLRKPGTEVDVTQAKPENAPVSVTQDANIAQQGQEISEVSKDPKGTIIGSAAKTLLSAIFRKQEEKALKNVVTAEKDGELTRIITVQKNDTFIGTFKALGYDQKEVEYMADLLKKESGLEIGNIQPGQQFILKERIVGKKKEFVSLKIEKKLEVIKVEKEKGKDEIIVEKNKKKLKTGYIYKAGKVKSTLVGLGSALGIPSDVVATAIKVIGSRVNLSVDVRKDDIFEVLYEEIKDKNGKLIENYLVYVSLKGKIINEEAFSYSSVGDRTKANFYDTRGRAFKKSILRNPMKGNYRLSSGFGYRKHPVLKKRILHTGTDFAAPTGTPIYAGGDGVITKIGRFGGYGNYIKIQHDSRWETAYGHMSRFAKGMRKWKRVKLGELIGYVGSTGRSTGPHLHYEIIKNGKQVDTRKVELPVGIQLNSDSVKKLNLEIVKIRNLIEDSK